MASQPCVPKKCTRFVCVCFVFFFRLCVMRQNRTKHASTVDNNIKKEFTEHRKKQKRIDNVRWDEVSYIHCMHTRMRIDACAHHVYGPRLITDMCTPCVRVRKRFPPTVAKWQTEELTDRLAALAMRDFWMGDRLVTLAVPFTNIEHGTRRYYKVDKIVQVIQIQIRRYCDWEESAIVDTNLGAYILCAE